MGLFSWFADLAIKGKVSIAGETTIGDNLRVTSANGRFIGIDGLQDGHEVDFRFGDAYNRIGTKYGDVVFISSYHGVKLGNYGGGSKPGLTVINAQANTNIAEFFGSDNVRKIAITQAGALVFPDGTSMATAAVGGGATAVTVTTMTRQAIHDAISVLPANSTTRRTIILEGTYANGSMTDPIIVSKSNLHIVSYTGATIDGTYSSGHVGMLMKVYGCSNTIIDGISFFSPKTGTDYALLLLNQSGNTNRISVVNCSFDCRTGAYNCVSVLAFGDDDATSVTTTHNNFTIDNCEFYSGRMGVEFIAHCWRSDTFRIINPRVINCRFWLLGNNDVNFGMGPSFSGLVMNPICENNYIKNPKDTGIEAIGCVNGLIRRNTVISNVAGCKGIALTDGKQFEKNAIANKGSRGCVIEDNYIDVPGPVIVLYYAYENKIGKNTLKGQSFQWQHADRNTVDLVDMVYTDETAIFFDASNDNVVTGGKYVSTKTTTPRYQNFMSGNGSTGNWLKYVEFYGSDSANGNRIQRNTKDGSASLFYWQGCRMDGQKVPDSLNGDKSLSNAGQLV